jgi:hypothetical protein
MLLKIVLAEDGPRCGLGRSGEMDGYQTLRLRLALVTGHPTAPSALNKNRAASREAYGRNIYGQSVLLARRLIEAGTRVACVSWRRC